MELEKTINDLGNAFETFKAENDEKIKQIEKKDHADPLLIEKIENISKDMSSLSAMKKELEDVQTSVDRMKQLPGGNSVTDPAKAEHAKAFENFFRKGTEAGLKDLEIKASLSSGTDTDGGFLVPEELSNTIDRVAETVSAMRRICSVMTIGTDTYKKIVSQGGSTSGWVAEKAARAETTSPTLAEIAINTKEIYANPAATQTILDDSMIDIAAWLANEVAIEFAEEEGDAFIDGNGVEKPKGINAYTPIANASYAWGKIGFIATGSAAITSSDSILDLTHALKSVYRNGAAYLMNDTTFNAVRQLKDGNGNYIWRPGLELGAPDMLLGKPVEIDDNLESEGSGNFPIYFANWKRAYQIIDRFGIRVLRDPYTDKPNVLFYTTKRVGGGVVNYEAIKSLKTS